MTRTISHDGGLLRRTRDRRVGSARRARAYSFWQALCQHCHVACVRVVCMCIHCGHCCTCGCCTSSAGAGQPTQRKGLVSTLHAHVGLSAAVCFGYSEPAADGLADHGTHVTGQLRCTHQATRAPSPHRTAITGEQSGQRSYAYMQQQSPAALRACLRDCAQQLMSAAAAAACTHTCVPAGCGAPKRVRRARTLGAVVHSH